MLKTAMADAELTGLLFDDTGDRMSPTHAKAHGKRYCYYVSSRINGGKRLDNAAWRIPASELDTIIIRSIVKLLGDQSQLVDWISIYALDADVRQCFDQVLALHARLVDGTAVDQRTLLQAMMDVVTFSVKASELTNS